MSRRTARSSLDVPDRVGVLLEEYRALYGLAEFRMASLDRRVPAAGALLTTFLGSVPLLPDLSGLLVLLVVPLTLVWFVRTTVNHARSFEDILRRIEAIESQVNLIACEELLAFQSSHPSRSVTVGGRTGRETIAAVTLASTLLLATTGALFWLAHSWDLIYSVAYATYLGVILAVLLLTLLRLRRYRYRATP